MWVLLSGALVAFLDWLMSSTGAASTTVQPFVFCCCCCSFSSRVLVDATVERHLAGEIRSFRILPEFALTKGATNLVYDMPSSPFWAAAARRLRPADFFADWIFGVLRNERALVCQNREVAPCLTCYITSPIGITQEPRASFQWKTWKTPPSCSRRSRWFKRSRRPYTEGNSYLIQFVNSPSLFGHLILMQRDRI